MATETTTEASVEAVAAKPEVAAKPAVKKPAARKPVAKKAAAPKPAKKPVGRKASSATKKAAEAKGTKVTLKASKEKLKESADKAQALLKNVMYAQLGVYGKVYDEVTSRFEATVEEAPKQWDSLVKRGEKVQMDFEKSQKTLTSKIKSVDVKGEVAKVKASYKESFEKVKGFTKKAA